MLAVLWILIRLGVGPPLDRRLRPLVEKLPARGPCRFDLSELCVRHRQQPAAVAGLGNLGQPAEGLLVTSIHEIGESKIAPANVWMQTSPQIHVGMLGM